jgi:small subunit ribosomal protein S8
MTDPVADMLTAIRNAQAVHKETVKVPYSDFKYRLAHVLKEGGYIADVEKKERRNRALPSLIVTLKYDAEGAGVIRGIKRMSTPGKRWYVKSGELHGVKGGLGLAIVSTPEGLMAAKEAKEKKAGGEYVCQVW